MPIEVMAERGIDTLRYRPMKPAGLNDSRTGRWPYAVVQLRQDNALGTLWNMVGFQTKLKHGEQVRIFRMIPGLEKAEFARRRYLPQQLHKLAEPPRSAAAVKIEAQHSFAGQIAARRPVRRCRAQCRRTRPAGRDSHGRTPQPHYRRRCQQGLPADERELRTDAPPEVRARKVDPRKAYLPRDHASDSPAGWRMRAPGFWQPRQFSCRRLYHFRQKLTNMAAVPDYFGMSSRGGTATRMSELPSTHGRTH